MISSTVYSKGNNNFKNGTFSTGEWSAPFMVSPKEIQERLDSFALCGRRIKQMRLIGLSYFHTRDWVESAAFGQLDHLPEAERQAKSYYSDIDPNMCFNRDAEIDEPILIQFADGDILEIETPQEPEFRISMNCIPWFINAGTNQPNVDANLLFAPCIGQKIVAVEVNTYTTDKDPMYCCAFDMPPYQRQLVSDIILRMGNGVGLKIQPDVDYCEASCVDENDDCAKIRFATLKEALFNWEDLHEDSVSGFEAESHTLFFGAKGEAHVDEPYITLVPSCDSPSHLHIYVEDFLVLGWVITLATGEIFNEYGYYQFSHKAWGELLDDASRILSIERFDDLFDELIQRQGKDNYMLSELNHSGAAFWKKRPQYKTQIDDIRRWSALVMTADSTMELWGFKR